jgi:hypothetical protein
VGMLNADIWWILAWKNIIAQGQYIGLEGETQLAHNRLLDGKTYDQLPMYKQIRFDPRYQAAMAERERCIVVQRETFDLERKPEELGRPSHCFWPLFQVIKTYTW